MGFQQGAGDSGVGYLGQPGNVLDGGTPVEPKVGSRHVAQTTDYQEKRRCANVCISMGRTK